MIVVKVLNLYAGIGGNRKLWEDVDVTAVEIREERVAIYRDYFPQDTVIVEDAHEFLLENYADYDFIWSSPPCPTHSHVRNVANVGTGQSAPVFPDMKLYEEIIFLQRIKESKGVDWDGDYVVENVRSYYEPLIQPQMVGRHYLWSNFAIPPIDVEPAGAEDMRNAQKRYGFDLSGYALPPKEKGTILKNCVDPELGKHILNAARKQDKQSLQRFVNA